MAESKSSMSRHPLSAITNSQPVSSYQEWGGKLDGGQQDALLADLPNVESQAAIDKASSTPAPDDEGLQTGAAVRLTTAPLGNGVVYYFFGYALLHWPILTPSKGAV